MAAKLPCPICIEIGATLRNCRFRYSTRATENAPRVPVDLTGCIVRCDVRDLQNDELYAAFTTLDGTIVLDDQSSVPVDGATGRGWYQLIMPANVTEIQTWDRGIGQLEIEFIDGTVVRHWEGIFRCSPEVTRAD